MKKNIPEETLEKIVTDKLFFKMKTDEICVKHGLSRAFVNATIATYKLVCAGDWDKVKFMLDGSQCHIKTVEWAAAKCGVEVPAMFYQKDEPIKEEPKAEKKEQFSARKLDGTFINFGTSANNTIHALIGALEKNTEETAQLRKAIFALLHSSGVAE